MTTRDLSCDEWAAFFNAFSRHYRGQPMSLQLVGPAAAAPPSAAAGAGGPPGVQTVARRMPLVGVTAECEGDAVRAIEIMVGDPPDEHLMHVVRGPSRVRVAQVSDGADELLLIDGDDGLTTVLDFSPAGLPDLAALATAPNGISEVL